MTDKVEYHEYANLFPMMTDGEFDGLRKDMARNGYRAENPIVMYQGKILDGRNRFKAASEVGVVPTFSTHEGDDPIGFVVSQNLHRRHLDTTQRAVIAAKLANMRVGGDGSNQHASKSANLPNSISQSTAAEMLNVSDRTLRAAKQVMEEAPELVSLMESGEITVNEARRIIKPHVAQNSGENEWYTPPDYISSAIVTMGAIDLDPASSEIANKTVKAEKYYTKQNNGLSEEWSGKVWMNPPYASDLIGKFVSKYVSHVKNGDVQEGIVLVNNATETNWFNELVSVSSAVVFPKGRVRFLDPQGNPGAPLQGQAIVYAGNNPDGFLNEFSKYGWGATC